ncbi:MAG: hypothetical protein ACE5R4_06435 [Armatimonadota bacterium]
MSDGEAPAADGEWLKGLATALMVAVGALLVAMLLRIGPVQCPNDASRWDTVWSLVERGTYVIDEAPWADTIDKVKRGEHFYSSKPALLPTMVAGEYWLLKKLTPWNLKDNTEPVVRIILLTVNALPLAVCIWLFASFLTRHVESQWWAAFWLVAAALGTYVTGYCVTFTNHTVGAFSALFGLYATVRIVYDGERRARFFILAGVFGAFTACNELPAGLYALALFVWLLACDRRRTLMWFLPAAALVAAAYLLTTYLSTGGFLPYYVYKNTELYLYEGSYWREPVGIDAAAEPKWLYTLHAIVGHHGIFSLSPIFVLSAVGVGLNLRKGKGRLRALNLLAVGMTVAILAVYVATTNNYGGVCRGLRWMFWLAPLWLFTGALGADGYGKSRIVKALGLAFLFVSISSMAEALGSPWGWSWLHEIIRGLGWVGY